MRCRIVLLFAVLLSFPIFLRAQPAGDWTFQQKIDRDQEVRKEAAMPALGPTVLRDVVQFRIEQGRLVVVTNLPGTDGAVRLTIPDLTGLCSATVLAEQKKAGASQPYTPRAFTFVRYDFDQPGETSAITVQTTPQSLQLANDIETALGTINISLIQENPGEVGDEQPVRLRVTGDNLNIQRSALTFTALRWAYPADFEQYIVPIFHTLHADAQIIGLDGKLALQVFAQDARPDPAITARLQPILIQLDADDLQQRNAATVQLESLGQPAFIALTHVDRSKLSPEQNSRIDAFVSAYHPVSDDEANRLRGDLNFLVDCLYSEDVFINNAALHQLQQRASTPIQFDQSLRGPAREQALLQLRRKLITPGTQP